MPGDGQVAADGVQFLPQVGHVDPHNALVFLLLILPHMVEQQLGIAGFVRVLHEVFHQLGLLGRKPYGALAGKFPFGTVQRHTARLERIAVKIFLAPGQAAQPGQQFAHGKRLRQIVVGTGVQTGDPVVHFRLGRQHDDRRPVPFFPQFRQGCDAVLHGHHDVEDHGVIDVLVGFVHSGLTVIHGVHLVAAVFQYSHQGHGHGFFVFCKQDFHKGMAPFLRLPG